ncbi:MAG: hypothetical protein J0M17_06190 [Planctomycetes bacterium]|nr:hypothetical protein [Planctomycetota bacterium]
MNAPYRIFIALSIGLVLMTAGLVAEAAPPQAPGVGEPAKSPSAAAPANLAEDQRRVAEKFKRFEQVIKLLAQFSDEADQDQARLLRQVFAEAQARSLDGRFDELVKVLEQKQLARAAGDQEALTQQLEELLAMLLSAERGKELKNEQARVKEFIKQIKQMINKQMELEGRTADGDPAKVAPDQNKLADSAGELARKMAPKSSDAAKPNDGKPGEGKPDDKGSEGKPGEAKKPGENKPGEQKPGDSKPAESKPGESKPGESQQGEPSQGKPSQGSPSQGKPSPGQPSSGSQSQDQQSPMNSPQKRVEEAQRRMEEARKRLEEAKREGAMKEQEEAIRELEQAKAELEEILRQLREEELARILEQLERRFTEMLRMQEAVYRDTQGLHAVPVASRGKGEEIEAGRLSREEGLILVEADKALNILKEEGSAVAFPRTVEQLRDDIAQIVELLAAVKVDELTLAVEEDVIAALKEMIEALQQAKKDLKDKKPKPPGEGGGENEQPLIDKIAELKMIRALQMRVNRRTRLINDTVDVARDAEALEMLRKLALTEQEVFQITRDIVLGKNK